MVKTNVSIYLIKDDVTKIIKDGLNKVEISSNKTLYFGTSIVTQPKWVNSFFLEALSTDDSNKMKSTHSKAVLIVDLTVKDKKNRFALTFGYGSSYLEESVYVPRFGLRTVVNLIDDEEIRQIKKIDIAGSQKNSTEQMPVKSAIQDFGFNIETDLISGITGYSKYEGFTGIVTGSDSFSMSIDDNIKSIDSYLIKLYNVYMQEKYKESFEWIDRIQPVKSKVLIERLDTLLLDSINKNELKFWMAVPENIEWNKILGFKYIKNEILDDIDIDKVLIAMNSNIENIAKLKRKKIYLVNVNDEYIKYWSAYNTLYGEIDIDDKHYCINAGKWYEIEKDYTIKIDKAYNDIEISDISFIDYDHEDEKDYNKSFSETSENFILTDSVNIPFGGGYSRFELCDVLDIGNKLIHIKKYAGSAALSHLFNQGATTIEMIRESNDFIKVANTKIQSITDNMDFLIDRNKTYEIVYAIICQDNLRPNIPFFSKIAIKNAIRRINLLNYSVKIKSIKKHNM